MVLAVEDTDQAPVLRGGYDGLDQHSDPATGTVDAGEGTALASELVFAVDREPAPTLRVRRDLTLTLERGEPDAPARARTTARAEVDLS